MLFEIGDKIEVRLSSGVVDAVIEKFNPKRIKVRLPDGNVISVRDEQVVLSEQQEAYLHNLASTAQSLVEEGGFSEREAIAAAPAVLAMAVGAVIEHHEKTNGGAQ